MYHTIQTLYIVKNLRASNDKIAFEFSYWNNFKAAKIFNFNIVEKAGRFVEIGIAAVWIWLVWHDGALWCES